jgi:hypothetical protein
LQVVLELFSGNADPLLRRVAGDSDRSMSIGAGRLLTQGDAGSPDTFEEAPLRLVIHTRAKSSRSPRSLARVAAPAGEQEATPSPRQWKVGRKAGSWKASLRPAKTPPRTHANERALLLAFLCVAWHTHPRVHLASLGLGNTSPLGNRHRAHHGPYLDKISGAPTCRTRCHPSHRRFVTRACGGVPKPVNYTPISLAHHLLCTATADTR